MSRAVSGMALGLMTVGGVVVWSGIKGQAIGTTLKSLVRGQIPQGEDPQYAASAQNVIDQNAATIGKATGVNQTPPSSNKVAALQAFAKLMLAKHGWPNQFPAFNSIVMAESSWNPNAMNPSGAYGIGQALGHGTAATKGTVTNEYGNFGTSNSICKAANSGNGNAQIEWTLNYIGQRYGDPNAAWAYHQTHGTY